ncbi:MAG: metallophosphoesterase [Actinomycetota bacterium]
MAICIATILSGCAKSAAPPTPPFVFAAKGDWGNGSAEQGAVTDRMCELRKTKRFELVVTTGDNFYAHGSWSLLNYSHPEACLVEVPTHRWLASWGNHDAEGTATKFVLAADRYYTHVQGPVRFFILDSNDVANQAQTNWLRKSLKQSKERVKIVVFHHPAFTSGRHPPVPGILKTWVPIFERHHVDLVLNGHNHSYEHLIVNGIDYVVSGGGGAALYPCGKTKPGLVLCKSAHHFLLVEVWSKNIVVEAITPEGTRLDKFEIRTRRNLGPAY